MKLIRFNLHTERPVLARLGAILRGGRVVDLRAATTRRLREAGEPNAEAISAIRVPGSIGLLIAGGAPAMAEAAATIEWAEALYAKQQDAEGGKGEKLFVTYDACRLHAPVRPTKLIMARFARDAGAKTPLSIVAKPLGAVVGPIRNIIRPYENAKMQFAPGIAIVIGRTCKALAEKDVAGAIGGYVPMADASLSQSDEDYGPFTLSMHDAFSPCGPWLDTELPKADATRVTGKVNGKMFDEYRLSDLPWSVARLVAHLSRIGFDPGDAVWIGGDTAAAIALDDTATTAIEGFDAMHSKVGLTQPPN